MLRASHLVPSLILSAFTLGACVESTELGGDELEGKVIGGDDGCPAWGCTGNSPTMGPFDFHELDLGGSDNKEGVAIAGAELQNGTAVRVAFRDGTRLVAEDNQGNRYQGSQLDGLVFKLRTPTGIYLMTINHVTPQAQSNTKMWIGAPDRVETYEIIYADALTPTRTQPVCHNPPGHEMAPAGGNAWPNAFEAILFTGDRYDAYGKTVIASTYADAGEWFNLACAGSAMAKLHLSRYTTAGADATHVTVAAQRQAMLKMYTGDFCGTGWSFTRSEEHTSELQSR